MADDWRTWIDRRAELDDAVRQALLERRLKRLGIRTEPKPSIPKNATTDELRLAGILRLHD